MAVDLKGHFGSILPGLNCNNGCLSVKVDSGCDLDPGRAVFDKFKVFLRHGDQIHISVETAIESKIGFLRIDCIIFFVADSNGKNVLRFLASVKTFCQFRTEG